MKKFFTTLFFLVVSFFVFAQKIPAEAKGVCPVLSGQELPDGIVQNDRGRNVKISHLTMKQPTVLIVYRGGWCPYCNKQLKGIAEIEDQISELGFNILALSPDDPEHLKESANKIEMNYTLLSDSKMEYAAKLGIAFKVNEETLKKYKRLGIDLEEASGEDHFQLPAPAVFVIDKKGIIQFSYVNPNYKVRLEADVLLAVLESMD